MVMDEGRSIAGWRARAYISSRVPYDVNVDFAEPHEFSPFYEILVWWLSNDGNQKYRFRAVWDLSDGSAVPISICDVLIERILSIGETEPIGTYATYTPSVCMVNDSDKEE